MRLAAPRVPELRTLPGPPNRHFELSSATSRSANLSRDGTVEALKFSSASITERSVPTQHVSLAQANVFTVELKQETCRCLLRTAPKPVPTWGFCLRRFCLCRGPQVRLSHWPVQLGQPVSSVISNRIVAFNRSASHVCHSRQRHVTTPAAFETGAQATFSIDSRARGKS